MEINNPCRSISKTIELSFLMVDPFSFAQQLSYCEPWQRPLKPLSRSRDRQISRYAGSTSNCTGFCTDCLHPKPTAGYWSSLGGSLEVIEAKDKSCRIKSL